MLYFQHVKTLLSREANIMQNTIQREITINASQERVYEAIANPDQVTKWFPETVEGDYIVGKYPIFGFGSHG